MANLSGRKILKAGEATITGPKGQKVFTTATCSHCNSVWAVSGNSSSMTCDPGGWCLQCSHMVCPQCSGKPCVPFEKKILAYEQRMSMLNAVGEL